MTSSRVRGDCTCFTNQSNALCEVVRVSHMQRGHGPPQLTRDLVTRTVLAE
jgi:hypothetical protein